MRVNPKLSASPRTASLHQPVPCRFSCSTSGIPTQPSHLPDQCNGKILLLLPHNVNHRLVLLPPESEVLLLLLRCKPTLQLQLNALDHLQPDPRLGLGYRQPLCEAHVSGAHPSCACNPRSWRCSPFLRFL